MTAYNAARGGGSPPRLEKDKIAKLHRLDKLQGPLSAPALSKTIPPDLPQETVPAVDAKIIR